MTELKNVSRSLDELKNNYLRSVLDNQVYPQMKEQLEKIDNIQELYYTNTPESRKNAQEVLNEIYMKLVNGVEAMFYNNSGIIDKLERGEKITVEDLEYQLTQVKIFNLWAERQTLLYFRLREIFYKQEKDEELGQAYRECYANNPHLLKLSVQWERAQDEDWINREKENKNKK